MPLLTRSRLTWGSFSSAAQMTPTTFGRLALNDPALVHELRRGREVMRSTRSRILQFIKEQSGGETA